MRRRSSRSVVLVRRWCSMLTMLSLEASNLNPTPNYPTAFGRYTNHDTAIGGYERGEARKHSVGSPNSLGIKIRSSPVANCSFFGAMSL